MVGSGSQERSEPNRAMKDKIAQERKARENPPPPPPEEVTGDTRGA